MAKVKFKVDGRSLKGFKKNVSIAGRGIKNASKSAVVEVCEDILLTATELVPIDTGALARSAGFKISGKARDGYQATIGYGVNDQVNKRTGKMASSYAGAVHENLSSPPNNGQPKFFEQAVAKHASELRDKAGKSIKKYLSATHVYELEEPPDSDESKENERKSLVAARQNESFTTQVEGKYLPFPVPKGLVYKKGGRWFLNKDAYKSTKDVRRKSVRGYKSTGSTASSIRDSVRNRYKGSEKAPAKKSTSKSKKTTKKAPAPKSHYNGKSAYEKKIDAIIAESVEKYGRKSAGTKKKTRKAGDTSSSIKSATKASKKKASTSASIKGSQTKAGSKSVKHSKFISQVAHETAIDEYIQLMMDSANEKERKKKRRELLERLGYSSADK